ncbi:hypothetical protein BJ138DRAFT_981458, partial [Hygrophoropsis aurantiaca]
PVKPHRGDTAQIAEGPDIPLVCVAVKAPDHIAAPAIHSKDCFIEWLAGRSLEETTVLAEAAR